MNRRQKICLWIGIAAIMVMGIFPPWTLNGEAASIYPVRGEVRTSVEDFDCPVYSFLLTPPELLRNSGFLFRIDFTRLCVQWIMIAAITGALIATFKGKKKD